MSCVKKEFMKDIWIKDCSSCFAVKGLDFYDDG